MAVLIGNCLLDSEEMSLGKVIRGNEVMGIVQKVMWERNDYIAMF